MYATLSGSESRAAWIAVAGVTVLAFPATGLAQQRIDPVPTGPESIVEALSPFGDPPDSSSVVELLETAATASGFPASDHDRILAARLWRLAGQPDLAVGELARISEGSEVAALAHYENARVQFEAGHRGAGQAAYWTACAVADEEVRAEIGWDLLPITTPGEREAWPWVGTGSELCDWLRAFWAERALRAGISRDERIAIHYQRLAEARVKYHIRQPRKLDGMADSFGRATGLAVDDRGLLLIRMGSPDYEQGCPEEVVPELANDMFRKRNLLGECWVYWRPEGYKIFYLTTLDRAGGDAPSGDYRVQEDLSQQAEPGTQLFQKYVMNSDLPEETKRRFVSRGPAFRNAKLDTAGVVTGVRSDPTSEFDLQGDLNAAEALALRREVRDATRQHTAEVLEKIPDVPDIESTVSVRFESLRFLNPSFGTWQVWLLNSVRAGDLAPSPEDTDASLAVGGRFVTLTDGGVSVERFAPLVVEAAGVPDLAGLPLAGVITTQPGPLPLTIVIEDLNAPGTGAWIQDTINVPAVGGLPQVSDIAVAQSEGGTWTRDGGTFLRVTPAHITNADGSIHAYFEVYGVRPGTKYEVELRLAPVEVADRIWRLEPDDLGFRLQFASEMPGDIGRHHLRLDLSDTKPGEYILAVRIQDEQSKAYSLPAVTDIFVAKRQ